jgi:molybdate transport system substrate-binding protein
MKRLFIAILLLVCAANARAQQLAVAAASDLSSVFPEIAARFEKETGSKVQMNFGSSGQFYLQLKNGAPFDLFFSADLMYILRLDSEGLLEPKSIYNYAVGKLVLYVPNDSPLDPAHGLRVLLSPKVKRVAIANPAHAPYGRAAVEALRREGIYDKVQAKLVMGENISQAAQFVQSGNADAGLVALSLARSKTMSASGRYVELPVGDYRPIVQAAGILKSSPNQQAAAAFLAFLGRPEISALLSQYGFAVPVREKRSSCKCPTASPPDRANTVLPSLLQPCPRSM